nr:hypothetical protein [uncultured Campylobacter sp.]
MIFTFKALRSPACSAKTFALFSCGSRLEKSARNFGSRYRGHSPTASAAALKAKITKKSWSLFLLPLPRSPNDYANSRILSLLKFRHCEE